MHKSLLRDKHWARQTVSCFADDILALRQDMDKMEKALERQKDMGTVCHAALFQRPSVPSYAVAECKRKAFVRYEGMNPPHC